MTERDLLRSLSHAQVGEEIVKNVVDQVTGILPGIVCIHANIPSTSGLGSEHVAAWYHFWVSYRSHRIRTRPPVRLGTVQAGSGATRAGVYQGSLLLSTPG